ncbi:carbohydrate-binding domain-containing protein [Bradyrhizobium sp. SEMIA]|uniref:carbohydrate-binding domain-containing protein n=1 Tax=Bradyrhizobium sp. SEMIA TaxID=2597515 RepID=UPI0018A57F6E|nr:carbohydrate-binding domain-containing protein [Bradyrhizobium sp. SEMIA]QOG23481.1 family 16 glycosylhydrolase [Bradyrhizobium sp. SEMIA]
MIDLTGYKLTFDDEFNARSISLTGAGTTWRDTRAQWLGDAFSDVGFGTSSFVDPGSGYDPFSVSQGVLSITAVPDRTPFGVPGAWESGLITTQGHFSQIYGYFEIRADFSNLPGAWEAFWLLPDHPIPDPAGAGHWQELDVVENYGVNDTAIFSGIHTTDPAPNQNWQALLQVASLIPNPAGYHTYGMNWGPNQISFYIDGQLIGTRATPSDMHGPMYLIADLATQPPASVGGVPITAYIDYIRVYSSDPNALAVVHDTVSSPDGYDPGLYGAQAASQTSPPPTGSSTVIGTGPDRLVLKISEDAYLGDALYTVSVDGVQIGGTLTAHASHAAGQDELIMVQGDWAQGDHTVLVRFLNDRWDGTSQSDRNLYVDGATYNGVNDAAGAIGNAVGQSFLFTDKSGGTTTPPPTTPSPPPPTGSSTMIGTGPDQLVLKISEDAYLGDALYTVSVDGVQIGGTLTAHASHAAGQDELITVHGDWVPGDHTVLVHFVNDRWDGTPQTDRNLYVDQATYNEAVVRGGAIGSAVGQTFIFHDLL